MHRSNYVKNVNIEGKKVLKKQKKKKLLASLSLTGCKTTIRLFLKVISYFQITLFGCGTYRRTL